MFFIPFHFFLNIYKIEYRLGQFLPFSSKVNPPTKKNSIIYDYSIIFTTIFKKRILMKRFFIVVCFLLLGMFWGNSQGQLTHPKDFFPNYGKEYHFQSDVLNYVKEVAKNSSNISIKNYGTTNQGRPLNLIFVSSVENIQNLEYIRQTNLYNTGLSDQKPQNNIEKALVWCSFGTHGNEAGTTGSVPQIVYELLQKSKENPNIFDNVVIVLDPCVNPDGYDRYVHFIKTTSSQMWIPDADHREHMESWPSGRSNHYMFDLNRDWAWQTQKESQERLAVYNDWLPHVHADFHEMGYNSNYYFAPAVEPYHKFMTDFQRQFQLDIGKNHAQYFDNKGWLYWTREVFDLFYPSYGDTYPTYSGAVGMTYEMAGNTASGRAILLRNGDTLTVQDKIDRNTVVALSTIEKSANEHIKVVENFKKFYNDAQKKPQGIYKSYVLKNHSATVRFTELLDRNRIKYSFAKGGEKLTGYHYTSQKNKEVTLEEGDVFISAQQPKSTLLQVLMEEAPILSDSMTYDITAWSLPLAYGLECFAFTQDAKVKTTANKPTKKTVAKQNKPLFSYEIVWNDLSSAQAVAALHKRGLKMRMTVKESNFGGRSIPKGTVFVHKDDNRKVASFETLIEDEFQSLGFDNYHVHYTGMSDAGGDLGGAHYEYVEAPRALTFSGQSVSQYSVGEIWYYFDKVLEYPLQMVDWDRIGRVNLNKFNVIILPEGWYSIDDNTSKKLSDWVHQGGRLIGIGDAVNKFADKEILGIQTYATEEEKNVAEEQAKKEELDNRTQTYGDLERRYLTKMTAGAIVKNEVDDTHPLGYGLGKSYFSLRTSSVTFPYQKNIWNVVRVPEQPVTYGFVGQNLLKRLSQTSTVMMAPNGKGATIYFVDNPLFRGFWDRGLLLFSNAVFLNNSVTPQF